MPAVTIEFDALAQADLVAGGIYRGGTSGHLAEEPLDALLHCGNMGGFRIRGGETRGGYRLAALYTTFQDQDWPDSLDEARARFNYFGDNKSPGRDLHDTPKGGNRLLRHAFEATHVDPPRRSTVPPFFIFSGLRTGRDVQFHGIAAPGAPGVSESDDLVAIWKTRGSLRFQNYKAVFTILDAPRISRTWLAELIDGRDATAAAPEAWTAWIERGEYRARASE